MNAPYLNHCQECQRYMYVRLLEVPGGKWRYLCRLCAARVPVVPQLPVVEESRDPLPEDEDLCD